MARAQGFVNFFQDLGLDAALFQHRQAFWMGHGRSLGHDLILRIQSQTHCRGCALSLISATRRGETMQKDLLRKVVSIAVAAICLGACALSEDKVAIDYIPPEGVTAVAGAATVKLEVTASDQRQQYRD